MMSKSIYAAGTSILHRFKRCECFSSQFFDDSIGTLNESHLFLAGIISQRLYQSDFIFKIRDIASLRRIMWK